MTSLFTPAELAAHLRTSERTIARMVSEGCPSILVGSRRRFDLAAVQAWAGDRACQFDKTRKAAGTRKHALTAAGFTDACRKVQLRVMPSAQNQN